MLSTPLSRQVTMASLTTRPHLHTTCLIVYVWTPRSWPGGPPSTHLWRIRWWLPWLKSFPPRMSAWNFSKRSWPSSKRLKFLRCLRVLQRHPTCSCYVVMPSSGTSISSPQFSLQCIQLRLKVTMWLVLNQRSFKCVSGPSDKLIVWQAHRWLSPSRKKSRPAQRRHPRRRLLGLPCLTGWAPLHPQRRGRSNRSRPFELAPEGPVHDPSKEARSLASLLLLPQPRNVDGSQVGARLTEFAPHWLSLLGNCRATGIVEDRVGIAFQQRPQLTHQSISFRTRNSRQDLQAVCKYLRFVVNKKVYQFTCLPFGLATSPREFTKLLRRVVSLLRQQGVKLHVYLDDWLIRAYTPEEAQLHAQTTIKVLQFLGWIINFEKSDLTPSQDFQFIGMQFNARRFSGAPAENASKGPVSSSTLNGQSEHNCQRSAQTSRHAGVHGLAGSARKAPSSSSPMVGRYSMVPEDRELVRPDSSSTMGSVRGGMVHGHPQQSCKVYPSPPGRRK